MNYLELIGFIQIVLIARTPVVFAAIGELVTEKSGVLNLGVEGMMLVGAVTAFVTLVVTGSYILAFIFSILPIVSTWPCTRCPPIKPLYAKGFSKFNKSFLFKS